MKRSAVFMAFVGAVLVGVSLGGCGGPDADVEQAVRDRLSRFAEALQSGDREAFVACYATSGAVEREVADATFELARAMVGLHEAMARSSDGSVAVLSAGVGRGPWLPTDERWAGEARLRIDTASGEATASVPGSEEPMRLVRREGRWLIALRVPGEGAGAREWAEHRAELMRRMAEAAGAVRREVEDGGMSAEAARRELGRRFAALIHPTLRGGSAGAR